VCVRVLKKVPAATYSLRSFAGGMNAPPTTPSPPALVTAAASLLFDLQIPMVNPTCQFHHRQSVHHTTIRRREK
jgi:hypothetical protein